MKLTTSYLKFNNNIKQAQVLLLAFFPFLYFFYTTIIITNILMVVCLLLMYYYPIYNKDSLYRSNSNYLNIFASVILVLYFMQALQLLLTKPQINIILGQIIILFFISFVVLLDSYIIERMIFVSFGALVLLVLISVIINLYDPQLFATVHNHRINSSVKTLGFLGFFRSKGLLWSPQQFGLFSSLAILFILSNAKYIRLIYTIVLTTLLLLGLYQSDTRTHMVALGVVALFLFLNEYFRVRHVDSRTSVVCLYVVVVLTVFAIVHIYISNEQNLNLNTISSNRIEAWSDNISNLPPIDSIIVINHSHNIVLDLINRFYGFLSILIFTAVLLLLLICLKNYDSLCTLFLLYVLTSAQFDLTWRIDRPDFISIMIISIAALIYNFGNENA